jgi:hypothetical protein
MNPIRRSMRIQTRDGNNITIRDLRTEYLNPLAPKADQL